MDFIAWIQQTELHRWLGESPEWFPYPFIIAMHAVGMGIIVGMNVALDLRILGVASKIPLGSMESFFPFMWLGLGINAVTGVGLTITHPELLLNWVMWIKFSFIFLALGSLRLLRMLIFRDPKLDLAHIPIGRRVLACCSILFWIGAIFAGRMTAYIDAGPV